MTSTYFDLSYASEWIGSEELFNLEKEVKEAHLKIKERSAPGAEFLGWEDLPARSLRDLPVWTVIASDFIRDLDALVVIGIGGSYLGARAVIDACKPAFNNRKRTPEILYAGHHLSEDYLHDLLAYLADREWGIVVISKSGTTTEPAIAFRILKKALEKQTGIERSKKRIMAITDEKRGALRQLAGEMSYPTFVIPDDVGGRFSVFTPVGIIPALLAGLSAENLLKGAVNSMNNCSFESPFASNPAEIYAAVRHTLLRKGKTIEILAGFQPRMHHLAEWWKQLFGESEGKEHKGIFPASVDFTTDLHSMGQYIQDGPRNLFETFILWNNSKAGVTIPQEKNDLDQLNYLNGWTIDRVNEQAATGTIMAHRDGGVPSLVIKPGPIDEFHIGQLLYIFEKACGISGYMLGVNPFDQPGVEAYKANMFRLLGKPGSR